MTALQFTLWVLVAGLLGTLVAIAASPRVAGVLKLGLMIYVLLPVVHFVLFEAIGDVVSPLVYITRAAYEQGMVRELGVPLAVLVGFLGLATYAPRPASGRAPSSDARSRGLFVVYLAFVVIALPLLAQIFARFAGDYLAANAVAIEVRREDLGASSLASVIVSVAGAMSLAALTWDWGGKRRELVATMVAMGFITVWAAVNTLTGSRVALVMPLLAGGLVLARIWHRARNRAVIVVVAFAALATAVPILAVVVPTLGVIRGKSFDASDVADASRQSATIGVHGILLAFGWDYLTKYDPVSYSSLLLEQGAGSAGVRPILASLAAPIPRVLYPSKPVPGSINQDYSGTPARIAAVRGGMSELAGNVPVSPAAVGIWELGSIGIPLTIVLNWGALLFVNALLLSGSIAPIALGIMYIGFPSATYLIGSPDTVVKNVLQTLVLLAAVQVLMLCWRWWRSIPELRDALQRAA